METPEERVSPRDDEPTESSSEGFLTREAASGRWLVCACVGCTGSYSVTIRERRSPSPAPLRDATSPRRGEVFCLRTTYPLSPVGRGLG